MYKNTQENEAALYITFNDLSLPFSLQFSILDNILWSIFPKTMQWYAAALF